MSTTPECDLKLHKHFKKFKTNMSAKEQIYAT